MIARAKLVPYTTTNESDAIAQKQERNMRDDIKFEIRELLNLEEEDYIIKRKEQKFLQEGTAKIPTQVEHDTMQIHKAYTSQTHMKNAEETLLNSR